MAYRKITVDSKSYQYVVGKTHVKVKGVGVWPKEQVGELFVKECECCGEPLDTIYSKENLSTSDYALRVLPNHVAQKISAVFK